MESGELPLSDLLVLELGHIVAAPSASLALAELGAEVIKIESKQGDMSRNRENKGSTFYSWNRNKKSVSLDLATESGRNAFGHIVKGADVVIDNYSPGALSRLGIDYAWGSQMNPGVIYLTIKGFLPGPYESRPGLDELAQMESGLAFVTGLEGQPLRAGAPIIDIGAGIYGALAVLAALHRREATGVGEVINVGLFETSLFFLSQSVSRHQLSGLPSRPRAGAYDAGVGKLMGWGVYDLFPTASGRDIFIAAVSDRQWQSLCHALGLTEFATSSDFDTNPKRSMRKEHIVKTIRAVTVSHEYEDLAAMLLDIGVPYAPVNSPEDSLSDAHVREGGHFVEFDVPGHPNLRVPKLPVTFGNTSRRSNPITPPKHGEHTREVLERFGVDQKEIDLMFRDGIAVTSDQIIDFHKS